MKLNLDSQAIDLTCSSCGQKSTQTIGWLKQHGQFTCACGQGITVDLSQLEHGLAATQKALDGISAALGKFGKR